MSTKRKSDGAMQQLFSPYDSSYEAFTNYMNVLSDFIIRVQQQYPSSIENEELNALLTTIQNQGEAIQKLEDKITRMKDASKIKEKEKEAKPA